MFRDVLDTLRIYTYQNTTLMNAVTIIKSIDELKSLQEGLVKPLPSELYQLTNPSIHLGLHDRAGTLIARCSLWDRLDADGLPVKEGLVGHYAATNVDAGAEILEHAIGLHRQKGHKRVIGPMDKSTWHRYRLVTDRGTEPTFFLEPDNPEEWPHHFLEAGFTPISTYTSALNDDISQIDPRSDARRAEFERNGITLRTIDMSRFEEELAAIHEMSLLAFSRNFLYSPIELKEFLTLYLPIRTHVIPELVILIEHGERLIGFIFMVPDLFEMKRGIPSRTVIIKSMAVHPAYGGKGLGGILMDYIQRSARKLGFHRVIYALMEERNRSRKISNHYGATIRRYTLYEKPL